jgi:hypothetical protein
MSRAISIGYRRGTGDLGTSIDVANPYYLLGTQELSMQFWSNPRLKQLGISQLSELGTTDPIYFCGWDGIAELHQELTILQRELPNIEFHPELKAKWLSHLVYCYCLLVSSAPRGSEPELSIG